MRVVASVMLRAHFEAHAGTEFASRRCMQDIEKRISSSEQLSREEAFELAAGLSSEPSPEVTRKLFYALDLSGKCSWSAIVEYIRHNERPSS